MSKIKVGAYTITTSNEDKILFPQSKITKGELIAYYQKIGPIMMRYAKSRLITMVRYPEGIDHKGFYHKNTPDYFPDWIERQPVEKFDGDIVNYTVIFNRATLVYLANQACITPHIWLSKVEKIHYPDRLIFDLDPSGKIFDFSIVRKTALVLKELMEELGLTPFVMTTGSRGLHVTIPIKPIIEFDEVREFARAVSEYLVQGAPNELTIEMSKAKRGNKIFMDYLRNAFSATAVAPYAIRPKEGAPVAAPIDWQEVEDSRLTSQRYTYQTIFKRLDKKGDPWQGMNRSANSLRWAMSKMKAFSSL